MSFIADAFNAYLFDSAHIQKNQPPCPLDLYFSQNNPL
ncbi:hypothetical protein BN128_1520 [Cronobacter sakazakii 696]|nr:hypothetical protein BN128_1520 [Cronobacter sakazakii 696]